MKTTNRRFSSALFCVMTAVSIIVTSLLVVSTKVEAQGTTITIIPIITSTSINTNQSQVTSTVNSLETGDLSGLNVIPNGSSLSVAWIFSHNGVGYLNNWCTVITSTNTFTLGQVQYTLTDQYPSSPVSISGTFGGQGLTYDLLGIGINSGPDGILGTTDDIYYTSGNANTPVNAVYLLGMSSSFEQGNLSTDDALHAWSISCPVTETVTYSVNGVSNSGFLTYTATPTPEPSTATIFIGSLFGLAGYMKFRKKQ